MTFALVENGQFVRTIDSSLNYNIGTLENPNIKSLNSTTKVEQLSVNLYDFIPANPHTVSFGYIAGGIEYEIDNVNHTVTETRLSDTINTDVDTLKTQKLQQLSNLKDIQRSKGTISNSIFVETDDKAQTAIHRLLDNAQANPSAHHTWKTKNPQNSIVFSSLSKQDVIDKVQVVDDFVGSCFSNEKIHYDAINLLSTSLEVINYDISTGWPV